LGDWLLNTIVPVDEDTVGVDGLDVLRYGELVLEAARCADDSSNALFWLKDYRYGVLSTAGAQILTR